MSSQTHEEKKEEGSESTTTPEPELPPEVEAFFKGKNKYKHPYGDWKPVNRQETLKRKTFGEQLDLPADNWHLPENQPVSIIPETKDDSHARLTFREREITTVSSSSLPKVNEPIVFKKRKTAANRQLRGSTDKSNQKKPPIEDTSS